jgi:hypothetical protein
MFSDIGVRVCGSSVATATDAERRVKAPSKMQGERMRLLVDGWKNVADRRNRSS